MNDIISASLKVSLLSIKSWSLTSNRKAWTGRRFTFPYILMTFSVWACIVPFRIYIVKRMDMGKLLICSFGNKEWVICVISYSFILWNEVGRDWWSIRHIWKKWNLPKKYVEVPEGKSPLGWLKIKENNIKWAIINRVYGCQLDLGLKFSGLHAIVDKWRS